MAWRLGHMAFAPKEKDALYMGAHVSLTGLRGMLAPIVGLYLYRVMGANGGLWLIAISMTVQVVAAFGFRTMRTKFANEQNEVHGSRFTVHGMRRYGTRRFS